MEVDPGSYRSLFLTTGCDSGGINGLNILCGQMYVLPQTFLYPYSQW